MCGLFRFSRFFVFVLGMANFLISVLNAEARDCEPLQIGEPVLELSWQNQFRREEGFYQAHLNYPYFKKGLIESCNPDGSYQVLWTTVHPLFLGPKQNPSQTPEKRKDNSLYFKVSEKEYSSKWPTQGVQVSLTDYGSFPGFTFAQVKDYYARNDSAQNSTRNYYPILAEVVLSRLNDQPINPGRLAYFFPQQMKRLPKPKANINRSIKGGFQQVKEAEGIQFLFPSRHTSDHD